MNPCIHRKFCNRNMSFKRGTNMQHIKFNLIQHFFDGSKTYATMIFISKVLRKIKLDVLHICTPLESHVPIAELAMNAGIHVVIEKPVAPSVVETELILKKAASRSLLVCAVHQFIFQEGVQKAKKSLAQIGKLLHVRSTICSAGAEGYRDRKS